MANKYKGEIDVTLGGATFRLIYDSNALAELDDLLGKSVMAYLQDGQAALGHKFLRAALFAGMQYNPKWRRGMSLRKVGDLIDPETFAELTGQVINGILMAWGIDPEQLTDEDAVEPGPKKKEALEGG